MIDNQSFDGNRYKLDGQRQGQGVDTLSRSPRGRSQGATEVVGTVAAQAPAPSHADIARRAYDIYINKGSKKGQCLTNWQQAERELRTTPSSQGGRQANI